MGGMSTRRVDDLVRALGIEGDQPERGQPDLRRPRRRGRGLPHPAPRRTSAYPYLWLDATYLKVREGGHGSCRWRRWSRSGSRPPGSAGSWASSSPPATTRAAPGRRFIRSLVERGLRGVRLVISDDHAGSSRRSASSSWARPGSGAGSTSPATPRTSCPRARGAWSRRPSGSCSSSPTRARPAASSTRSSTPSPPRFPRVAELLTDAEPDLLAHFAFPETHRRQIRSTNPLERLNKEIKRRTGVVGIFPNRAERDPPGRDDPRRAGRRVAGRPALLPARDDGAHRRRHRQSRR